MQADLGGDHDGVEELGEQLAVVVGGAPGVRDQAGAARPPRGLPHRVDHRLDRLHPREHAVDQAVGVARGRAGSEAPLELRLAERAGLEAAQVGERLGVVAEEVLDRVRVEALARGRRRRSCPRPRWSARRRSRRADGASYARRSAMGEQATEAATAEAPDGIDRAGVEAWFAANVPEVEPPLSFERISGGRSNLTYRRHATRPGTRWALRRPPLGKRLGSAHDMGREHRVVSALAGHPGAGPAGRRPLRGRVGQRRALLRDGVRRGPDPALRPRTRERSTRTSGGRSASASSTPWSRSTRSIPTRSGSASSAARRTTSRASCSAGRGSGRSRRRASCRSSTRSTTGSRRGSPSRARRRSSTATTGSTT